MSVPPDGLLVVDKPTGWTSHDVVARARRLVGTRRVGHAGTLDPMATGVLVLGVGRATRLLGHLALGTKAYDATMRLGQTTVTDDAEGDITGSSDASKVGDADLGAAVAGLTGEIEQVPSAVSAIKIHGERAYKRVRAGEEVEIPPRPVTVSELTIGRTHRHGELIDVEVHVECSTGTYVRALARDIGATLEVGGHLTQLRRTRLGPYDVGESHTLDALAERLAVVSLDSAAADNFPTYTIEDEHLAGVRNGRPFNAQLGESGAVAVLSTAGEFVALYEQHGPVAKPVAVFAPA
ncbi:MAG: tRNA pseudouridine(55) synthase TruB [Nocardioidaceae bacterium]